MCHSTRVMQRLQHHPFRVRQIAWQAQPFTGKLLAGDIGPHLVPPWLLDTSMNHNRLISLKLFFGQALGYERYDMFKCYLSHICSLGSVVLRKGIASCSAIFL